MIVLYSPFFTVLFKVTNNFAFLGHTALKIGIHMSDQSWNISNECCHKGFFKVQHTVLVQKKKASIPNKDDGQVQPATSFIFRMLQS